jgi:hypothetical protein
MDNVQQFCCCKNTKRIFLLFAGLLEAWLLIDVRGDRLCVTTVSFLASVDSTEESDSPAP